jgi:hypothetical protein
MRSLTALALKSVDQKGGNSFGSNKNIKIPYPYTHIVHKQGRINKAECIGPAILTNRLLVVYDANYDASITLHEPRRCL